MARESTILRFRELERVVEGGREAKSRQDLAGKMARSVAVHAMMKLISIEAILLVLHETMQC